MVGTGCDELPSSTPPAVTIEPIAWPSELLLGDTMELAVELRDGSGQPLTSEIDWEVGPQGFIRLVTTGRSGEARATATVVAALTGMATIRVTSPEGGAIHATPIEDTLPLRMKWRWISAGAAHSCAVTWQNQAHCWGAVGAVQFGAFLGDGSAEGSDRPVNVVGNLAFDTVSAGRNHSCGLVRGRTVFCWGANTFGAVGNRTMADQLSPVIVFQGPSWNSVSAGAEFTCGVSRLSTGVCFGRADVGQLGSTVDLEMCDGRPCRTVPKAVMVGGVEVSNIVSVGAGTTSMCAALNDGSGYCWGDNARGLLGNPAVAQSDTAVRISTTESFRQVSVGSHHACALANDGRVLCWGTNQFGELGVGSASLPTQCDGMPCSPVPIAVDGGVVFRMISVGDRSTCAVTDSGVPYCWGWNRWGQVGSSTTGSCNGEDCAKTPVSVPGLALKSVSVGAGFACGVTPTGAAYCWGRGDRGEHGDGDLDHSTTPRRVLDP